MHQNKLTRDIIEYIVIWIPSVLTVNSLRTLTGKVKVVQSYFIV